MASDLLKSMQLAKGKVRTEHASCESTPGFQKFFIMQLFIQFRRCLTDITIYQPSLFPTSSVTIISIVRAFTV